MKQVNRYFKRYRAISLASGIFVFAVGTAVLVGWTLNIPVLMSLSNGALVTMKVNTALAFMLGGLALALKRDPTKDKKRLGKGRLSRLVIADAFSVAILLVGTFTLCEYLFGWELKIDDFFIKEAPGAVLTLYPGRMAPTTAVNFILVGFALVFLDTETRSGQKPAQYLAVISWWLALIALAGYFFHIPLFFSGLGRFTAMPLHTTILFLVLTFGIILVRPDSGITKVLNHEGIAGQMIRRMLPAIFGAPFLLVWMVQLAEKKELFSDSLGDVLVIVGLIVIITIILWRNATALAEKEFANNRVENMLQKQQEEQQIILDSVPAWIFYKDTENRYIRVNKIFAEIMGMSKEQLEGKSMFDLHLKEQAEACWRDDKEVIVSGKSKRHIVESVETKKGSLWVQTDKIPYRDAQGNIIGIIGFATDITERKQAEDELRESKTLIEAVVENVPLMIFLKEAKDLRFVVFNRAGEELLGYDRKTLLGKNNLDLFPPEQAAHFMAKDREVLDGESGMLDIPEEPILTAKKGQRLLHTRKVCIRGADGVTKFLLGISEDITERKQAEEERNSLQEQLIRSEKLAAVGELIAGVVHEINNPLTGILGFSELLLRENKDNFDEETKKSLQSIYQSSERIEKIVKNLQRFARREEPIRKNVNINELIDVVTSIRNYEMEARNIKVERNYQPDLPLVMADPSQLEQVFLSFIINAEYAIHDNQRKAGTLTIATSTGLDHAGEKTVVIEFSDTGPGIPSDVLPKLFNPFFTTKGIGKGTGLGLSVSYGIIKEHGGEIFARNQAEGGAVFTIELPV